MRKWLLAGALLLAVAVLTAAKLTTSASTNFCIQLNGGSFSGDLGFFRFKGSRPMSPGAMRGLAGRGAGLSPAFGTATVAKDGSFSEFGVTFFIDAEEGQFDVSFFPPSSTSGSGYASYGTYGVNDSVTATVVSCSLEP